ncbi:hypothetical protein T492DRAFT_901547 [Pavlovales sp. CCMP2436]|nr:hypothetical protein T492DRAFT_901547 [Pavlovales sp. CCMP2436]
MIMEAIGCDERGTVTKDNMRTIYNRLSIKVHTKQPDVAAGFCCGGDVSMSGFANAIALKMFQDDADVIEGSLLNRDLHYLNTEFKHTHTFMPDAPASRVGQALGVPARRASTLHMSDGEESDDPDELPTRYEVSGSPSCYKSFDTHSVDGSKGDGGTAGVLAA